MKGRYTSDVYVYVLRPDHHFAKSNGIVKEHRIVYEEEYNCCLLPWAVVHHRDGNKHNNVWYNLQLLSAPEHIRLENTGKKASKETRKKLSISHQYPLKDMSNRVCSICGGQTRTKTKEGRPDWYKERPDWYIINKEFACYKCYMKEYHKRNAR